jgi:pimeloyl-ACP methyl ester carboxylesterase
VTTASTGTPVIFINGLWLHQSSWQPWVQLFEDSGYDAAAPGWPGIPDTVEAARSDPDSIADHGITDVTAHYAEIIDGLDTKPVVIGHSFGGIIAEKLLGLDYCSAAIGIDAAPIKGVLPLPLSSLRSALPVFRNPANIHRAVSLTPEQFRFSFGNAVSEQESAELYDHWAIPAPGKPLFEAAEENLSPHSPARVDTRNEDRGPLLLMMGGMDNTVPESITKSSAKQYRHSAAVTELAEFPERGHSLTIDSGWQDVADTCLGWLADHNLPPAATA